MDHDISALGAPTAMKEKCVAFYWASAHGSQYRGGVVLIDPGSPLCHRRVAISQNSRI